MKEMKNQMRICACGGIQFISLSQNYGIIGYAAGNDSPG